MKEKDIIIKKVDEAIKDEATSAENKELLKEIKAQLISAKGKNEYIDIVLKIANIIGTFAKLFIGST